MAQPKIKTGIMGGTFNPIHYGHLLIAENAAEQFELDEVLFIPTGHSPHKVNRDILDPQSRCEMIELAISGNNKFRLSRMEIESNEVNYTYRTLERLNELEPERELYFVMGGDSLHDFLTWKNPQIILQLAHILVAIRDENDAVSLKEQIENLKEMYSYAQISCLMTPNYSLSSHNIRDLVNRGQTIRYMVPEEVRHYIEKHKLYQ